MRSTFQERIKNKLLKLGRKNQFMRIVILPVLAFFVFIFNTCRYVKGNTKRISMLAMTLLFSTVYCSFSFPLIVTGNLGYPSLSTDEMMDDIFFAKEEAINVSEIELLSDEEVMYEEYNYEQMTVELYDAQDILLQTQDRDLPQTSDESENENPDGVSYEDYSDYVFDKDDWRLILVNKQNSIPEDYTFELGNIMDGKQCDERVMDDLRAMLKASIDDGVKLFICSPYRDSDRQVYLFERKVKRYMGMGMSYVDAYRLASKAVTVPGTSEHELGIAFDIISNTYTNLDEGFADTPEGIWLAENSYKYGFILRYPLGKEYITGIEYEPWHFRYVGVEAATVITQKGYCLEEFLEDL